MQSCKEKEKRKKKRKKKKKKKKQKKKDVVGLAVAARGGDLRNCS